MGLPAPTSSCMVLTVPAFLAGGYEFWKRRRQAVAPTADTDNADSREDDNDTLADPAVSQEPTAASELQRPHANESWLDDPRAQNGHDHGQGPVQQWFALPWIRGNEGLQLHHDYVAPLTALAGFFELAGGIFLLGTCIRRCGRRRPPPNRMQEAGWRLRWCPSSAGDEPLPPVLTQQELESTSAHSMSSESEKPLFENSVEFVEPSTSVQAVEQQLNIGATAPLPSPGPAAASAATSECSAVAADQITVTGAEIAGSSSQESELQAATATENLTAPIGATAGHRTDSPTEPNGAMNGQSNTIGPSASIPTQPVQTTLQDQSQQSQSPQSANGTP